MKELKDKGYFIMDGGVKSTDFFEAAVPSGCSSPLTLHRPRGALHGSMFPSEYRPAGQSLIKFISELPSYSARATRLIYNPQKKDK
jgi:hypothetical protein